MALLPLHQFFAFNESFMPVDEFVVSENKGGIYEVIRIIDGKPLFWKDHVERFFDSAALAEMTLDWSPVRLKRLITELIQINKQNTGNVLISYKTNLKAYFIPHNYPDKEAYLNGICCAVLEAERENPNAKVFQTDIRAAANALIQKESCYEVILVDPEGLVREGSRSNLFFIHGQEIFTSKPEDVLLGITRQKTIRLAGEMGIKVTEANIPYDCINQYDAAFITGTSPKILPVKKIGSAHYDPTHPLLTGLIQKYDALIRKDIEEFEI